MLARVALYGLASLQNLRKSTGCHFKPQTTMKNPKDPVIRELEHLLRKLANPPRACMCSEHIAGQDANRAEVRKLIRERIKFHSKQ